jgi:hypothetical protein
MRVSGLGERGKRLRSLAALLEPKPLPPFYVERPDEVETRAIGWHMRVDRGAAPEFLGHNFIAAELQLRQMLEEQAKPKRRQRKARA